jgi:ribonuclease HII
VEDEDVPAKARPVRKLLCGVDEAGRGPLAGPVYAAAVILNPRRPIDGLRDSKKLSAAQREKLAEKIYARAVCWTVAWASVEEIDRINILQATLLAMRRAVDALTVRPHHVQIDGNQRPTLDVSCECIVKGDDKVPRISAASIIAKTRRDAYMRELHAQYPDYCFDQHMGYSTALHLERLGKFGASPVHRRSFAPVRLCVEGRQAELPGFAEALECDESAWD